MIHERLKNISNSSIRSMLEELCQVKGYNLMSDSEATVFGILDTCQRDVVRDKREKIDAANFYKGSALKTKVEKLDKDLYALTEELCSHFGVSHELVVTKTFYVFLNDIYNPKSKIRKPPPLRW